MPGGRRESMVIVVPTIAEGDEPEDEAVPAVIGGGVWTVSPQVTEGVDRPRRLQAVELPEHAAPKQADEGIVAGPSDGEPYQRRNSESHQVHVEPMVVDPGKVGATREVMHRSLGIIVPIGIVVSIGMNPPTGIGMPETAQQP